MVEVAVRTLHKVGVVRLELRPQQVVVTHWHVKKRPHHVVGCIGVRDRCFTINDRNDRKLVGRAGITRAERIKHTGLNVFQAVQEWTAVVVVVGVAFKTTPQFVQPIAHLRTSQHDVLLVHLLGGGFFLGGEAYVEILQDCGFNLHISHRLDRRGPVEYLLSRPHGMALRIQTAPDVEGLGPHAGTQDFCPILVVDVLRPDIQPLPRRDDGRLMLRALAFCTVVHRTGLDAQGVAVDAAGADVVQGACSDLGVLPVDEAPIAQAARGVDQGGGAADFSSSLVVDVLGLQREGVAGLQFAAVVEGARCGDAGVAVGDDFTLVAEVFGQGQVEVALGEQFAVAAQAGSADRGQGSCDQGAAGVGDLQGLGGCRVLDGEGVACADESGCVVHTATAGEGGVLVGTDGALGVVNVGSAQQHIAPFQTQPGDQGLAVVDTPGLQVQGLGAAHEARAVVDGAAACLDVGVAQGLDLSTCAVVKAGAGEVHGGLAHDLPRCVVDLPRGGAQLPLCAQEARSVVKCAGAQGQCALAADAALAAGMGCGVGVVQGLAVGVDAERTTGLQQPALVVECAAVELQAGAGGDAAQVVVQSLALGVEVDGAGTDLARIGIAQAGGGEGGVAQGLQFAPGIVDGPCGTDIETALHGRDLALAVVQALGIQANVLVGGDQAVAVVERLGQGRRQSTPCGDAALAVVQTGGIQGGLRTCGDLATGTVVENLRCGDVQAGAAGALHNAALVEQVLGGQAGVAVAGDGAALVGNVAAAVDLGCLGASLDDFPAPVAEASHLKVKVLGLGAGTVMVDTVGHQA